MEHLDTISVGFSIGLQMVACYFVFRIMIHKLTPTVPWLLLFLMTLNRAYALTDALRHWDEYITAVTTQRLILSLVGSMLAVVAFGYLWFLLSKKYG